MKRHYAVKMKLPDEPGVYIFRDRQRRPIYIGRATSLRGRVLSYFHPDLIETRGPRIVDMVTKATSLSTRETRSVLEAILLESSLIKKYQPHYNVDERDDKSAQYVIITDEPWPRVFLERARDFEKLGEINGLSYRVAHFYGPFLETGLIKEALRILRRLFPFRDKKSNDPRHEEFYRSLGRSPRTQDSESRRQYLKNIRYLNLFFRGESEKVRRMIASEMKRDAKNMEFEKAEESKRLLNALYHVNDIALLKRESGTAAGYRIEAYDVAHLSGTNVVGSMAVSLGGQPVTSEYRRFKIRREANDDLAGLSEIVGRRLNHTEWELPDLMVVDGDDRHMRMAQSILAARRINIPVVAVTKDDRHRAARILGNPDIVSSHEREIVAANAEAHRFAISYHRKRRNIGTLYKR